MAVELGEQLNGDADFGERGGLLEGIGGVAAGVGAAEAAEFGQGLVGARYGRDVEMAFAGNVPDRELGAPVAALHALLPV
jgi:hypothetical protein